MKVVLKVLLSDDMLWVDHCYLTKNNPSYSHQYLLSNHRGISGVNPTAIEIPNSKACNQSPFVRPFIKITTIAIITMKRINNNEVCSIPTSKLVFGGSLANSSAKWWFNHKCDLYHIYILS